MHILDALEDDRHLPRDRVRPAQRPVHAPGVASLFVLPAQPQENFSGARVIRAYAQEEAEIRSFETANQEYIARSLRLVQLMGMLWPTLEAMLALGIVLVLWLGGREVLLGHIQLGPFVTF